MPESLRSLPGEVPALVGESPVILRVREEVSSAARTTAKVLIAGETGTGKEVVARQIHAQSARRARAFIAVNCGGVPETLLESEMFGHVRGSFTGAFRDKAGLALQADGGTLFLDEMGEMSLRMQATLLRFAETGEIQQVGAEGATRRADVRLITATHRDLLDAIAEGQFRQDLYYRLNVIHIHVPPLRDRGTDILLLARHYFERAAQAYGMRVPILSHRAEELFLAYHWPGNVRQLRNVTERLVLADRARPLTADDLPQELRAAAAPGTRRDRPAEHATEAAPAGLDADVHATVDRLWHRMRAGEDFWTVVAQPFRARALNRSHLMALVDRGLTEARGSYRTLLHFVNLPVTDYKRFHSFLHQQRCNLPVAPYRLGGRARSASRGADLGLDQLRSGTGDW